MGEQVKTLEDHADVEAVLRILHKTRFLHALAIEVNKRLAVDPNFAVVDLLKSVEQADQRGFPGAGRANH